MKFLPGLVFVMLISLAGFSQQNETINFKYISPVPGSSLIMPENNIAFRHGDQIDSSTLKNFKIMVEGSQRGKISGETILSSDGKTIIFKPDFPFQAGERVYVKTEGVNAIW